MQDLMCKGFYDLCVEEKCFLNNYEDTIRIIYNFGYHTVAINQTIDATEPNTKKKKNAAVDPVPEPYMIVPVTGCEMKILNRLTISFSNQDVLHNISKSPNYKKFHIIAAMPQTSQAFMYACGNLEMDILSFNPENKNDIRRNRKMFKQLLEKGVHLEIPYGQAIEDTTKRKHIISTAHIYHTYAKSRNVILSSGATNPNFIRSPYDVINLGFIFGLNEHQAKEAVANCGRDIVVNAVGRRHGKAVMFVDDVNQEPEKIPNCSVIEIEESSDDDVYEVEPGPKRLKQK